MGIGAALLAIPWLLIAAYVVSVAVNWRDQSPSDAAARLAKSFHGRRALPHKDNAYIYLMGFSVDRVEDPRRWGIERVEQAHRVDFVEGRVRSMRSPRTPVIPLPVKEYDVKEARTPAAQAVSDACTVLNQDCLGVLEANEGGLQDWLAAAEWILERYRTLLAHPAWGEAFVPDVPEYGPANEGQRLLLARAWLLAGRRDAAGVKALLEEDIRFWRRVLAASNLLMSKLVATEAIRRHFAWSNLILRRLPAQVIVAAVPESWLVPISPLERSTLGYHIFEWMHLTEMLRYAKQGRLNPLAIPQEESVVVQLLWHSARPLLQVQDASNRYAELIVAEAELSTLPYELLPEAIANNVTMWQKAVADGFPPSRIYNVVGDVLFAISVPSFAGVPPRLADLEGVRRMSLLAVQLRSERIAAEQVPQKLREATARNPYTAKPFAWDEANHAIVFSGIAPGERGRHAILY